MSWNWPSYSRECLLYWLCWHLAVETSSLGVKQQKSTLQYFQSSVWRHVRTLHSSFPSGPTNYGNPQVSGFRIQNTLHTGQCSQHKMNGELRSMSWKYWSDSDIGSCACPIGIQSHCITLSQCTMTCSITWMMWCDVFLGRKLNGMKTCSWRWS